MNNHWKDLNAQGFIPGVNESEEAFEQRVEFCLHLQKKLSENAQIELPFQSSDQASQSIMEEASDLTKYHYGMHANWVLTFFSNYQLSPWHAGCAWIFQLDALSPTAAFLQLRSNFRQNKSYLGIYNRSELISHELAHVGRMMYNEPKYEEILAYSSSPARLRRFFGPIIQSSKESLFFIFVLLATLMIHLALFSESSIFASHPVFWLPFLPVALILFAFVRLVLKQMNYKRCLKKLTDFFQNEQTAKHLIYRLTDKEIDLFAKSNPAKIRDYVQSEQTHFFRWKFLANNYPF